MQCGDDGPDLVTLYETHLTGKYRIIIVVSDKAGFKFLDELIAGPLLDRRRPAIVDGEAIEGIRESELANLVITVTATESDNDIVEMELNQYVTTPFSRADLRDGVESVLSPSRDDSFSKRVFSLGLTKVPLESSQPQWNLQPSQHYTDLLADFETVRELLTNACRRIGSEELTPVFRELTEWNLADNT